MKRSSATENPHRLWDLERREDGEEFLHVIEGVVALDFGEAEPILLALDLVPREEFEAVKAMAAKARAWVGTGKDART